jgi:threonine dehydratase
MEQEELLKLQDIQQAKKRISGVTVHTPLIRLDAADLKGQAFVKAESFQPIGSFKLRGAYNKVATLPEEQRRNGVIAYSSGNHAQGVAYAARALGIKAVIVMPSNAPEVKRRATAALGAEIVTVGPSSAERQKKAEELSKECGYAIIPPYNDLEIIAGQGTCGLEILEDLPDVDLVLAPTGGGGLLSGVAAAIKLSRPQIKVIGVEPELAADATESYRAGHIVTYTAEQTSRTLADGLRTQSIGERNLAHLRTFVDDMVNVTEREIRRAMRELLFRARLVPEPSGAVTTAALLFHATSLPSYKKAVAILSGGNVEPAVLKDVLNEA